MKKLLLSAVACIFLATGSLNASFPVSESKDNAKSEAISNVELQQQIVAETEASVSNADLAAEDREEATDKFREDDWILLALWFVLGGFAAHRWYAGKPVGWNILFILTAGGCGIWAIVDLIKILQQDFM